MIRNIKELEKRIGQLNRKEENGRKQDRRGGDEKGTGRQNEGDRMKAEEEETGREEEEYYNKGNREGGEEKGSSEGSVKRHRMKAEIEEVIRIRGDKERGLDMILAKLGNEEEKRNIIRNKKKLKGRKEKIMKDWTQKERRMR